MEYGLIGEKLGHSFSPRIHARLSSYGYALHELKPEEIEGFITARDFRGLNVTIPYKKSVLPFCDRLSPEAEEIGCVNTLVVEADGSLSGHNTDIYGFCYMANRRGIDFCGKKILILGSGGTSLTASAAARRLGALSVSLVSRSGEDNYSNLHRHFDAEIIINTTPVGMYPNCGASPVELRLFPKLRGVIDVVYNPLRTELLLQAEALGIPCAGGLPMLIAQAKASAELFLDRGIPESVIEDIYSELVSELNNLILIGMPGSGKSTVGGAVAKALGREFFDLDDEIARKAGISIPEIFAQAGENGFRKLESEVVRELGQRGGCVIATGGGVVLKSENYAPIKQNGVIIQLTRSLDKLPSDGRPLSQGADLAAMHERRRPYYSRFADAVVSNDGSLKDTVKRVLEVLNEISRD